MVNRPKKIGTAAETPAVRAQVLRDEADRIEADERYGHVARLTAQAILRAHADQLDREDPR